MRETRIDAQQAASCRQLTALLLLIATCQLAGCAVTYRAVETESPSVGAAAEASAADTSQIDNKIRDQNGSRARTATVKGGEFDASNPRVANFVETFQTRWRGFYQRALDRGGRYLPNMQRVLREENVPAELAYLPLIESGFRTQAVSHAGAVGPWQFIRETGRRYGLRIDGYVDERRDPVKSTHAAARYLKDLYSQFGDWHLSLAAYNTGEMNVARALERRGSGDYWEMSERGHLPRETCDFVPQFLAAVRIAQAPEAYGFERPSQGPLRYDLVQVDRSVSLKAVAKLSSVSVSDLTDLNPALHRGMTPPQGYTVRVPKGTKAIVEVALARMRHDAQQLVPARTVVAQSTHTLRRGETLAAVAKRNHVSLASLMQANRIHHARQVAVGRVLHIPQSQSASKIVKAKKPALRIAMRRGR